MYKKKQSVMILKKKICNRGVCNVGIKNVRIDSYVFKNKYISFF